MRVLTCLFAIDAGIAAGMILAMLEGPQNNEGEGRQRRLWRWAIPIGAAVLVAGVLVEIVVSQDQPEAGPKREWGKPRFLVTAGKSGDVSGTAGTPWFQIHDVSDGGTQRLVANIDPPSPSAGEVGNIVSGPGTTFVLAASRAKPCETVLYRFKLTDDGHAKDIAPVTGGSIPALVGGLAISPDGRRIAYATAPCGDERESTPAATAPITLAVLDTTTGQRRAWTSSRATIVGEIVWASDSHTVGYTKSDVTSTAPPAGTSRQMPRVATVGAVQVRAVDVDVPGTDLLAGRVLFDSPGEAGTVVATAVMNSDGRTGYGVQQKGKPPSTLLFTFGEGEPMKITSTIPASSNGSAAMISVSSGDGPRYACLNGVDAFGRVIDGQVRGGSRGFGCTTAYDTPN
jgi:hypothetical protein